MSVRVYKVKLYNVATDEMVISRRMATAAGAQMMGGDIVDGTEVDWKAECSGPHAILTHTRRRAFSEGLNPDAAPVCSFLLSLSISSLVRRMQLYACLHQSDFWHRRHRHAPVIEADSFPSFAAIKAGATPSIQFI
jgi:hypothetical protein